MLYIHTAPPPSIAGTDAVFNEAELLASRFSGQQISLFPFSTPSSRIPRALYGWHKLYALKQMQQKVSLNHIFGPSLYYYPVMGLLTKPTVYSIVAGIRPEDLSHRPERLKDLSQILVSNQRDVEILTQLDFRNVTMIKPGLDLSRFAVSHLELEDNLHLLMASAPWEFSQFNTKGIDLILELMAKLPEIKLTLLWRGHMLSELEKKIYDKGLGDRIQLINQRVDVTSVLKEVHATILLAKTADLVKAYPHSLIESLAMGKPVIVSSTIAMSDYVSMNNCGQVVQSFDLDALEESVTLLQRNYVNYALTARLMAGRDFTRERMFGEMEMVYRKVGAKISP